MVAVAARQGGRISSAEMKDACGLSAALVAYLFSEIAEDLQARRIVPGAVSPMLTVVEGDPDADFVARIPGEVVVMMSDPLFPFAGSGPSGKYQPLTDFLARSEVDSIELTFAEIEDVLGAPLAPSARRHLPYWYSRENSLGKAITAAGFRASQVRLDTETVTLVRRD